MILLTCEGEHILFLQRGGRVEHAPAEDDPCVIDSGLLDGEREALWVHLVVVGLLVLGVHPRVVGVDYGWGAVSVPHPVAPLDVRGVAEGQVALQYGRLADETRHTDGVASN